MQMGSVRKMICMGNAAFGGKPHANGKRLEEKMHGNKAFGGKPHANEKRLEEKIHGNKAFGGKPHANEKRPEDDLHGVGALKRQTPCKCEVAGGKRPGEGSFRRVFFATTFWKKLQKDLEKVAFPKWRMLQQPYREGLWLLMLTSIRVL